MFKKLWGKLRCKLDWHDPEEVPFEWRDDGPPGCKTGTNAQCRRCGVRQYLNWMTEVETKAILREQFPELYRAQWGD